MHENIVLYGAGRRARNLIKILELSGLSVSTIVDSNAEKCGKYIGNYVIETPDVLENKSNYVLCITVGKNEALNEIRKILQNKYLIDLSDEITYEELVIKAYEGISFEQLGISDCPIVSEKKTIIFDCKNGLELGGIQEWAKAICSEFVKRDEFDAYILTNYGNYVIPEELNNNILRVDVKAEDIYLPSNISKIVNCILQHMPCVLVTSHANEIMVAAKILKEHYRENIQIISGIRNGHERDMKNYCDMSSCTDLFVCVSSDIQKNMIQRGIDKDKVLLMLCPMACPDYLERSYTVNGSEPIRIGYAGRIVVEQKRMDLMLELIYQLEKKNVNYYMELAGEGNFTPILREFINKNQLNNKIKLVGRLDQEAILEFWKDKDICINIADYEGRARSIAEAMANGAVPVVTRTSGVNDDIVDEENGYIVDIGDYASMAERIEYLDKHRNLLENMGYKAHFEIKQKGSMEDHYRFWKSIIF